MSKIIILLSISVCNNQFLKKYYFGKKLQNGIGRLSYLLKKIKMIYTM